MTKMNYCPHCGNILKTTKRNDKIILLCANETCSYIFWDNPTPVVAAIVEHDEKLILARNKNWPEDLFGLITGFLEKNETVEEAIIREVKEKLNLQAKTVELIGVYSFFEMNQVIIAYQIKAEGKIKLSDELAEI